MQRDTLREREREGETLHCLQRERERDWTLMSDVFMCEKVRNTHARTRHKEKAKNMYTRARTHTHTHTQNTHTRQELAKCFPVMHRRHVWYRS